MSELTTVEEHSTEVINGVTYKRYKCPSDRRWARKGEVSGLISEKSHVDFLEGAWVDYEASVHGNSDIEKNSYIQGESFITDCHIRSSKVRHSILSDVHAFDSTLEGVETYALNSNMRNSLGEFGGLTVDSSVLCTVNIYCDEEFSTCINDSFLKLCDIKGSAKIQGTTWIGANLDSTQSLDNVEVHEVDIQIPWVLQDSFRLQIKDQRDFMVVKNVGSENGILNIVYDRIKECVFLQRGCFFGTYKDFKVSLEDTYGSTSWDTKSVYPDIKAEYEAILEVVKARFSQKPIDWDATLKGEDVCYSDKYNKEN